MQQVELNLNHNKYIELGTTNGTFVSGDIAIGTTSGAQYTVDFIESAEFMDKYDKGDEIERQCNYRFLRK